MRFTSSVWRILLKMLTIHIIAIFPETIEPYLNASILKRAQNKKLVSFNLLNLRGFANDKHKTVDDKAYGGGPGMVLKVEPIYRAIRQIKKTIRGKSRTILFSTRGKVLNQKKAVSLSKEKHLIFICGRYEGVDERVARHIADEEISIGNFVLSGGELPALIVADAVARHIPGVLGKPESLEEKKGSYPVYTRPPIFNPSGKGPSWKVPKELISGNHASIAEWRKRQGKREKEK